MLKRTRVIMLSVVILILFTVTAGAYQSLIKKVTVIDDGVSKNYSTKAETVQEFFEEQGIRIKEYDELYITEGYVIELKSSTTGSVARNSSDSGETINEFIEHKNDLIGNEVITIIRAKSVNLIIDKERSQIMTCKSTVEEFFDENNVVLGEKDTVDIDLSGSISNNMYIQVKTYKETTETEREVIKFTTEERETNELLIGEKRVIQEGSDGEKLNNYKLTYLGSEEINKEFISEEITIQPINAIVEVGTYEPKEESNIINTEIGDRSYKKVMTLKATAYTPYEGAGHGITYTGMKARYGVVAVDPNVIPLYSKLYIEGYGEAIAGDIGGSIKGNKIDLCYESTQQMLDFGVRNVTVYILE